MSGTPHLVGDVLIGSRLVGCHGSRGSVGFGRARAGNRCELSNLFSPLPLSSWGIRLRALLHSSAITGVSDPSRPKRCIGNHLVGDVIRSSQQGLTVVSAHRAPSRRAIGWWLLGLLRRRQGDRVWLGQRSRLGWPQ